MKRSEKIIETIEEKSGISRRQFLGLTGGVIGAAALASAGFKFNMGNNEREIDPENMTVNEKYTDILVIGGGMAGLFAAVKGHDAGSKVTMVVKGRLGTSGQTPFAKGMFKYDPSNAEMDLDKYLDSVTASALNTNNPVFLRQAAENSMDRINELTEWGFFDGPLCYDSFAKPINERNIPVIERVMITHLIKENGRIAGAAGFSMDEEVIHVFKAKSVVLCSGAGGFKPNGFPICDLTHDGTVMAYEIGAKVTGKEWNDGHGGKSDYPAACYDGWGNMFEQTPGLTGMGVHHDLGVDVNYTAYMTGNPVDARAASDVEGGPYVPDGFGMDNQKMGPPSGAEGDSGDMSSGPPSGADGEGPGGPPSGDNGGPGGAPGQQASSSGGASAGLAIHKSEGLVPINENCESTIPGLYAAGDALGSYMAGAIYTQVGSSLTGSAVQGAIASEAAAAYSQTVSQAGISSSKLSTIKEEILAPLKRDTGYGPAWVTQTLQGIMIPNFVIYIKKERILNAALAYIEELRDHHSPMMRAANLHELRLAHETANMIVNAEMKLKASLMRTESRCSHYRLDYPEVDYDNWQAWINISRDANGEMKFEKQAFGTWPKLQAK